MGWRVDDDDDDDERRLRHAGRRSPAANTRFSDRQLLASNDTRARWSGCGEDTSRGLRRGAGFDTNPGDTAAIEQMFLSTSVLTPNSTAKQQTASVFVFFIYGGLVRPVLPSTATSSSRRLD